MARIITSGAECNDTTAPSMEGVTLEGSSLATIDTGVVRSGSRSYKCNGGAGDGFSSVSLGIASTSTLYTRAYVNFTNFPSTQTSLWAGSAGSAHLQITSGGVLRLVDSSAVQKGADGVTLALSRWYRIELFMDATPVTGSRVMTVRVDGQQTISDSTFTSTDVAAATALHWGWVSSPGVNNVMNIDDIAVNDTTGAAQNSWPGDGKVVLLLPTADSAVGTGWTLGTGTAIAGNTGSTAVKNTPPLGVADLAAGSDPKQIRNATSNANTAYDATMTTYVAAGVDVRDVVNVIDPIVVTAAPVVTSAKAGTVGLVSNPAITAIALGAGGTAGAFWSGVAGGTYATGWKVSHGTVTYGSAVTVGTAPVMRINQVTASTRIAVVCFMGIHVDFTPWGMPAVVTPRSGPS